MRTIVKITVVLLGVAIIYLSFWPTPLEPVAWEAPADTGFTGDYAANDRLSDMTLIPVAGETAPEDIAAINLDGVLTLFASSKSGAILRIDPVSLDVSVFARTGGVPLGIEFLDDGTLLVADAFKGLLSISPVGDVRVLTDSVNGEPILYADDLDIGPDGVIYFSDASQRFGAEAIGGSMAASELDILEQSRTGRILAYDPKLNATTVFADDLSFANGVAITEDGSALLVAETGRYRVWKYDLSDRSQKAPELLLDNLPGFPDNINRGPLVDGQQTYLLGLAAPRLPVVDTLSNSPMMRKVISRLPQWLKPAPEVYSIVIQFTADGRVLQTWQDPGGRLPSTTGGLVPGDGYLYITSVTASSIGRVPYP